MPPITTASHASASTAKSVKGHAKAHANPAAYAPATADTVNSVSFEWARACRAYTIAGSSVWHRGGGELPYRPVIGNLALRPNTGKYYFACRINTGDSRIGFCTATAYPSESDLREKEFGRGVVIDREASVSLVSEPEAAQPSYLQVIGAIPAPPSAPWEAYIDLQTARVYVNGRETKQLWRLVIPTCGGVVAFVVDTDAGLVQLFVDGKYEGMMLEEDSKLKGRTVYPCVGISGFDMANRSTTSGYMCASVEAAKPFDCFY